MTGSARAIVGIVATALLIAVPVLTSSPASATEPGPARLTLEKIVDNHAGGTAQPQDWTLSAVGDTDTISGPSGSPAVTDAEVISDTYLLYETDGPAGYQPGFWFCDGGFVYDGNKVKVEPGASVVCRIVNTAKPATWKASKSSDPPSGTTVQPGDTITYTLTVTRTGGSFPTSITLTDDLSQVSPYTSPAGPAVTSFGAVSGDDSQFTWTLNGWNTPTATLTYSVVVDAGAFGVVIKNVLNVPPHKCDGSCTTTHETPKYKKPAFVIEKTHDALAEEPMDSDAGQRIPYRVVATNVGTGPATSVVVGDLLPPGLSYDEASVVVTPSDWAVAFDDYILTLTAPGPVPAGATVTVTFDAIVGELPRDGIGSVLGDIVNLACITSAETPKLCDDDVIKLKSIALQAQAVCVNNTPYVSYAITPNNIASPPPPVAMIWWTAEAFAARNPAIDAGDTAALLADGASQVDYVTVPGDWSSGETITGQQLWPGAAVDADGNPTDWPGWTELPDGTWILDPLAPFYDLRLTSVIEFRINPTVSTAVDYPPAEEECGPTNPDVDLGVVKTHGPIVGDAVDSGDGDVITYTITITNHGTTEATGVSFTDVLPTGLTVSPGSIVAPAGWTFTITSGGLDGTTTEPLAPGDSVSVTFGAIVGELPRASVGGPIGNLTNDVCVDSTEPDMNPANDCNTDVVRTKSIALTGASVCRNDTPYVSYTITPTNILSSPPPVVALIWWTPEAYADRDPDIDASQEAAILADGALEVEYLTIPGDWSSGEPLSGEMLWPGAAVDADGNPTDWPGWNQLPDGTWFLDPTDPFYALRSTSIVEFRINPTVAFAVNYPPPTALCVAGPFLVPGSPGFLAMTGTGIGTTIAVQAGALLLAAGAALARRRRRRRVA